MHFPSPVLPSSALIIILLHLIAPCELSLTTFGRNRTTNLNLCPAISLRSGTVRYKQRGHIARFICYPGYTLIGDRYSVCSIRTRQWDSLDVKCIRANCKETNQLPNLITHEKIRNGVLEFFCTSGYQLHGPRTVYCEDGNWNSSPPTCLRNNQSRPLLSCDFESADLCGWSQDFNHDFDWRRENYKTESGNLGTGPSNDHTTGADGYYMYIESSARQENETARLISPVFAKSPESDVCFGFFYHMYGKTIGELRVYLKLVNESWNFQPDQAFFRKTGNQGNYWWGSLSRFGRIPQDYQIIIEGIRGASYISDIAIDDVRIVENCAEITETTPNLLEEYPTTETVKSTFFEPILTVESCENRCNLAENTNIINFTTITCDCNEACWELNRCCPDYFDFCVEGTSTTLAASTKEEQPTIILNTRKTTLQFTTKMPTVITTQLTTTENDVVDLETNPAVPQQYDDYEEETNKNSAFFNEKVVIKPPQLAEKENNTRTLLIAGGVLFGVVFVLIPGIVLGARRKYLFCTHPLRRMTAGAHGSGHGDSQSDVRFLTSDEILDFSLQNDDYDDL